MKFNDLTLYDIEGQSKIEGQNKIHKNKIYFPERFGGGGDNFLFSLLDGEQSLKTVVACGVSGGQDSDALAIEVFKYLKTLDYRGEFILIHADLGIIEHRESLPQCRRLANHLNAELVIVRPRTPMLERWEKRWTDNCARFSNLKRVKLLSPWSSADMRFCTSEEKVAPITGYLKKRFPGKFIINAVGLRREESPGRAKKPLWQYNKKLKSVKLGTDGIDWYPILDYLREHIAAVHFREKFCRHPVYEKGNQRISCVFCVLGSRNDLQIGLTDEINRISFRRIINLEIKSTFSFQQSSYLAEIGFDYLTDKEKVAFDECLKKAAKRKLLEKQIPKELLFGLDHFPAFLPNKDQAEGLAVFRRSIGEILGIEMKYVTSEEIRKRYAELIKIKEIKIRRNINSPSRAKKVNPQIQNQAMLF